MLVNELFPRGSMVNGTLSEREGRLVAGANRSETADVGSLNYSGKM
jgi:hypothetical protein